MQTPFATLVPLSMTVLGLLIVQRSECNVLEEITLTSVHVTPATKESIVWYISLLVRQMDLFLPCMGQKKDVTTTSLCSETVLGSLY